MKPRHWILVTLTVVAAAIVLIFLLRPASAPPPSPAAFDIGMVTFPGYAPLYLAKEKGFFEDLPVNLHRIEDIGTIRAGVVSNHLEAYLATLDIALDTNTDPPGVAVWAIDESSGGDGVVVAGDIEVLPDLRGRSLAAEPGFPPFFLLLYLLNREGLALSDVRFLDMTTQDAASAFSSGRVDAAGVYEPYLSTALNSRAGSKIVLSSRDTPGLIVDLIFARSDVPSTRSADVKTVISAWKKALVYIEEYPDDANAIMARAFDLPVDEFKDVASSVRWLNLDDNRRLFGTAADPGALYQNFPVILDVLQNNRSSVYSTVPEEKMTRVFIQ